MRTATRATCPVCLATLDAAAPMDRDPTPPRPGDLTMCLYCGSILAYSAAGIRVATQRECLDIEPETRARMEWIHDTWRRAGGRYGV